MHQVTKKEFFRLLKADPRDIMPSVEHRDFTTWKTRDNVVVAWSYPGWANTYINGVEQKNVYAWKNA